MPDAPIGELDTFDEQVKLMFDLIVLAYQANLTRVASYIMVAEGTNRTYNHIGVSDAFHPLSHHANDRERLLKLVKIQRYHVERFADFVAEDRRTIPDGDGTLLDNSLFMYGSNMSNSDRHNNYPLPNILVGGACGALKGGQHIILPEHTSLANLHLTVLNKVGARADELRTARARSRASERFELTPGTNGPIQRTTDRRTILRSTLGGAVAVAMPPFARQSFAAVKPDVARVTDAIALRSGAGGNVLVRSTPDGQVLIDDSGAAESSAEVLSHVGRAARAAASARCSTRIGTASKSAPTERWHVRGEHRRARENAAAPCDGLLPARPRTV